MKKPGTISIKEVATAEALEQAQQIRAQVLEAEQGFPHEVNIDGRDPAASHLLMLDEDAPVATARLTIQAEGEGKIARIAVLPSHRGRGLGQRLIRQLESLARRNGLHTLYVEPHARLEPFFRRLGYVKVPGSIKLGGYDLIKIDEKLEAMNDIDQAHNPQIIGKGVEACKGPNPCSRPRPTSYRRSFRTRQASSGPPAQHVR